jgi:hypothetical protein
MLTQSEEQTTTPQEQESSTTKAGVPPEELLDEFKRYRPLLVDWLERLYVDCYAVGLCHTKRAGWHLLLNVSDDHYEVVLSQLHEMPETTLSKRIDNDAPADFE